MGFRQMLGEAPGLLLRGVSEVSTPGPLQRRSAMVFSQSGARTRQPFYFFPMWGHLLCPYLIRELEKTLVKGLQDFHVASVGLKWHEQWKQKKQNLANHAFIEWSALINFPLVDSRDPREMSDRPELKERSVKPPLAWVWVPNMR